ncbi:MAG TPA: hypothetical protein VK249_24325, partial [Anaerolineales bacterium]|nr:hypothetical protein [Anaerolineales bacterium]
YHYFSTLLYAVAWGYFVWLQSAPAVVVEELQNSGVVTIPAEVGENAKKIVHSKFIPMIAAAAAILASALNFYQDVIAADSWLNGSLVLLVLRYVLLIVPTTYVVIVCILRFIVNARVFKQLLRGVKLHPLHPDNAGGLHPLGSYALKSTYPLALAGSIVALAVYWSIAQGEPFVYFYFAALAYVILAPLLFFAPLASAHSAMLGAKNDLKKKISKQFNEDYSSAYNEISGSARGLKDNLEKLEQLQKLYKIADSFPVWPFDMRTIRQFVLTMFSPIGSFMVATATDYLRGLLGL